jgi:hypothetical protein
MKDFFNSGTKTETKSVKKRSSKKFLSTPTHPNNERFFNLPIIITESISSIFS